MQAGHTDPSSGPTARRAEAPAPAPTRFRLDGHGGELAAYRWEPEGEPRHVVLLVHGYGEHMGRYGHVAAALTAGGSVVYGVDHAGHGHSAGERVLLADLEPVVEDVRLLHTHAATAHPGLPVAMIGHSLGGTIAARYAQRFGDELVALVLSAPAIGEWAPLAGLLAADPIPDVPIDPDVLSRDPAVGAAYAADPLVWHGPFKRPTLEAMQAMLATVDAGRSLDHVPVLWVHGEDDRLVPYDGTAAGWAHLAGPGDEARTYPGARHEVFNETIKREVIADVLAFLDRQLSRAARRPGRR